MKGRKIKYHPMVDFTKLSIVKKEYRKIDHKTYAQTIGQICEFLDMSEYIEDIPQYEFIINFDEATLTVLFSNDNKGRYKVVIPKVEIMQGLTLLYVQRALRSLGIMR